MTTTAIVPFDALRDLVADVLSPASDDDPAVLVDVVDSVTPPAIMLLPGDPYLEVGPGGPVMGPCLYTAHLQVFCVAARMDVGPGFRTVDQLVGYVIDRMRADSYTWPLENVQAPRVFDIGGTSYLCARVNYAVPTTV